MTALLSNILANKHTTGAGIAYAIAKFGCPLLGVWWPGHDAQLKATEDTLEGLAVFYGLAAAGDAGKSVTKEEAETKFVAKPAETTTPKTT